jgi:hypothetical protein
LPPPGWNPGTPTPYPYGPPPGYAPAPPGYGAPPAYGYGYPPPAYAPPASPPKKSEPDRPVHAYGRVALGLGPPAFSDETRILHLEGYQGAKLWVMLDGAYFVHPNIGLGVFGTFTSWTSSPGDAPGLSELAFSGGGQIPIKFGTRAISFVAAPRIGFAAGKLDLGGGGSFQPAFAFGVDLGVVSFKYHVGGSVGIMRAAVPPPGEVGRDHDYGGLYLAIGGTFDG